MRPPPLRSVALKLLVPMLGLLVVADMVVVGLVQGAAARRLEEQLLHRGQMISTAITYAVDGAERAGQLERFVAAIGSDRAVRDIVLIAGDPAVVVASTRNEWNARPIEVVRRQATWLAELETRSGSESGRLDANSGIYAYKQPLLLSNTNKFGVDLAHGRILLELDARPIQAAVGASTARLATWLVAMTLLLYLGSWFLLRRLVLVPIGRINHAIATGATLTTGQVGDELDALAAAYQHAVDAQRAGERRLNALIENASDLIYVEDGRGAISYASPSFSRLVGIEPQAILGRVCLDLVEPADHGAVAGAMAATLQAPRQRISFEQRLRDEHGKPRTFSCIAVSLVGSSVLDGVVVTCHDITERKLAESRLQRGLAEVEGLLDAVSALLIGIGPEDRVVLWNRSAERITGRNEADVLGRRLGECAVGWPLEELSAAIAACRAHHHTIELAELRCLRADGREVFLQLSLCPGHASEATVLILGRDTTETKLLQSQINQSQKLESIGQLAAGVAHEINTPTQFVGDNLRFLGDGFGDMGRMLAIHQRLAAAAPDERPALAAELARAASDVDLDYLLGEIPRAIAQSLEGTERIAAIVGAMKDFAHPDSGELKPCDLNRVVSTTLTVARNEYKYLAELVVDLPPDLPPVTCLAGEIGQVVLNMVVNAAHAIAEKGGERGSIRVATRIARGEVEIEIADSGAGIPEAVRGRIFDPFFTTKPVGKGTGQGLFLAHAVVVRKHGGRIEVASRVGEGTTFTIVLPLAPRAKR